MDLRIAFSHPVLPSPNRKLFVRLQSVDDGDTPGDEIPINVHDTKHVKFEDDGVLLHLDEDLRIRPGQQYAISIDKGAFVSGNSTSIAADVHVLDGYHFMVAEAANPDDSCD
jgi:hypothetical protein